METVLILAGLISLTMSDSPPPYDWNMNTGVEVIDAKVDNLVTYFDNGVTQLLQLTQEEQRENPFGRQPRLNHNPFSINIVLTSDEPSDAIIKIFIGPKFDTNGYPENHEADWMDFFEIEWFLLKLSLGKNQVKRNSSEFKFSVPTDKIWKLLYNFPKKLILPKDTSSVYLLQLFIFVYPFNGVAKEDDVFKKYIADNEPFDYPFVSPVQEAYFKHPNMMFKDLEVHHEGEMFPYQYNV